MQTQMFSKKIERNLERMMPVRAVTIVRRLAHDLTRKSRNNHELDQRLELAHAALHMQLYQRYGTHASDFMQHAHDALDELASGNTRTAHLALPLELKTPA